MTVEDRQKLIDKLFNSCQQILHKKGHDYAGANDSLANFKRNAERLGLSKYQIWAVYFNKHIDAINNSIKSNPNNPQVESEPLSERIKDAINYLAILQAILVEDKTQHQAYSNAMYSVSNTYKPGLSLKSINDSLINIKKGCRECRFILQVRFQTETTLKS